MAKALHVGIIAGEPSGDMLAGGLMRELNRQNPNIRFSGIGGKHMLAQGLTSLVDMDELSVMGLVEVLGRLPRLLRVKHQVLDHFETDVPDVFIGVDAPDFNLRIETVLKQRGIKTVHYVSPTVWAWREKRIHKIAKATNLVLGLFPFEAAIYQHYNVPYKFVGHTLADSIPLHDDGLNIRKALEIHAEQPVLALLPGSRKGEVNALLLEFLRAAQITGQHFTVQQQRLMVLIPAANDARKQQIVEILQDYAMTNPLLFDYKITDGQSRECLLAANAVLIASGTATLEAMLCKRPMVVAYKMARLTRFMMGYLYKPKYFSLPNLLGDRALVTELLQAEVNADNLAKHLIPLFGSEGKELQQIFTDIHQDLKRDADKQAAEAVLSLISVSK
ncbi:lipid-A-disaccharide synthase [Alteromonas sp. ASW11-36]|uniref:Lipid-A-disaccharide synthase n=1 Tax=Alteromonas arenosi TaxID=3055817 RepID=A0ABT7SVH7_9ALTE|nr:lipid-A-disaccharide synthase [Alteromonas sp. ASW11-36]MDM7860203.1 lipid-A-disaccharide synthase [Alteromonas sp. ASW11-36]